MFVGVDKVVGVAFAENIDITVVVWKLEYLLLLISLSMSLLLKNIGKSVVYLPWW